MATIENGAGPKRPPMTVQVGVTGHRALPGADSAALQAAAAGLFREIGAASTRLLAADQAAAEPVFAPGPPRLRCVCGLASGADSLMAQAALGEGWDLVAALPFPRAEFAQDFAAADLPLFHGLLSRAAAVSELDGDRGRGGEPYADIGRQIVEQSDILLTIWDGMPPRGPGGTGDVVHQALDRGVPVAVLPPTGPATLAWHGTAAGVDAVVAAAVLPPDDPNGFPQAYYREVVRPSGWAAATVRWFERAVLVGIPPAAATGPAAPPSIPARTDAEVDAAFDIADRLAGYYAARYRVAGLMRYGLIVPATVGAFLGSFGPPWAQPLGYVLQAAAVGAVVAFSARGGWARDQRRFIAYRSLAEYLRNARLLAGLGAMPAPPPAPAFQERVADWAAWYGHAVMRGAGLASTRHDAAALAHDASRVRAAATGEIAFLRGRSARFAAIARRLQRIGVTSASVGIGLVAVHAAMALAGVTGRPLEWFNELALVAPALAPVSLGVLGFGDYGRLSTRYAAVAAELQGALAALDRAGPGRNAILPIARRVAQAMLAEGADWQLLIKARTLSAI